MNACFLDQKLTSKRCVKIRLLYALKNSNHHGIDYSKKFETLFLNFKFMSSLRKPENHHKPKINKIFAPVFTGKIFVSY